LVGNPAADQTVTGSACGQNFLKVSGPGFPGGGQQNNLFSTIIGKIAHVCGNGVLDLGEQCDDGNLVAGDCCSPICEFEAGGSPCTPNPCISGSTCDGAGACVGGAPNTLPCNDGPLCTADSCGPATGCVHTPLSFPCPVATVVADAFVNSGSTTTNYGTSKVLTADASPIKRTFLRINVSGVSPRTVASARLHLQVAAASGSNSNSGGQMHAISNCAWGEKTSTWKNQPVIDGLVLSTVG